MDNPTSVIAILVLGEIRPMFKQSISGLTDERWFSAGTKGRDSQLFAKLK